MAADDVQEFYSAGAWTWHKPRGGRSVRFFVVGAGGAGGRQGTSAPGSGGGGGGAVYTGTPIPISFFADQDDWPVIVGVGGDPGSWLPPPPPDLPHPLVQGHGTVVASTVYFNGGSDSASGSYMQPYRMFSFNATGNYYTTLTPFSTAIVDSSDYRSQFNDQLITVGNQIYSVLAEGNGHVHRYTPASDSWTDLVSWDGDFAHKPSGWDHLFYSGTATDPGAWARRVAGYGNSMYVWAYQRYTVLPPSGAAFLPVPDFWAWNPGANTWTHLADSPVPLYGTAIGVAGKIYIYSYDQNATGSDRVPRIYVYDIAANTWSIPPGGAFPGLDGPYVPVAIGTMIYYVGYNGVRTYDTAADSWGFIFPAIPGARGWNVPAAANDDLYIFGGQQGTTLFVDVLTPLRTPLPDRDGGTSSFHGAFAYGGAAGGDNGPPGGAGGSWGMSIGMDGGLAMIGGDGAPSPFDPYGGAGGVSGLDRLNELVVPSPPMPGWDDALSTQHGRGGKGGDQPSGTFVVYSQGYIVGPATSITYNLPTIGSDVFAMTIVASTMPVEPSSNSTGAYITNHLGGTDFGFTGAIYFDGFSPGNSGQPVTIAWPSGTTPGNINLLLMLFVNAGRLNLNIPGSSFLVYGGPWDGTADFHQTYSTLHPDGIDFTFVVSPPSGGTGLGLPSDWHIDYTGFQDSVPNIQMVDKPHPTAGAGSFTWHSAFPLLRQVGFGSFSPGDPPPPWSGNNGAVVVVTSMGGGEYLRMNQRDDGQGITRKPRITGAGQGGGTSTQSTRAPRVGTANRYR